MKLYDHGNLRGSMLSRRLYTIPENNFNYYYILLSLTNQMTFNKFTITDHFWR